MTDPLKEPEQPFFKDKNNEIIKEKYSKIPQQLVNTDDLTPISINFEDVITGGGYGNSVEIAPNRYAGISFYSPYPYSISTWATRGGSYSYPNSLIVGHVCNDNGTICSWHSIVIDFAQNTKDISFLWGRDGSYGGGSVQIYEHNGSNYQLISNSSIGLPSYWTPLSSNQFTQSQRIRRIILSHPATNTPNTTGHIYLDNVQFTPNPTVGSPIGNFDHIPANEPVAYGWTLDPDQPSNSSSVACYTDVGTPQERSIGIVPANYSSPDVPYPGNHRFQMPIPYELRNGVQHTMHCYGNDLTGDPPTHLPGSPKIFKFNPTVGQFDLINSDGEAIGWSKDTDLPNEPIIIHFYLDGPSGQGGTFIGETLANLPRTDPNQNGHGFNYFIPAQYRDGNTHSLYAYGLDQTGGQHSLLTGSPKFFNLQNDFTISNPRVSGDLSGTTQPALLGGDIELTANANAGTFEWSFAGQYTIVSGTINSPAITIRSTDSSPIIATVKNTISGIVKTRRVNINVVVPSLNSFTAEQRNQFFYVNSFCNTFSSNNGYAWTLGCLNGPLIPIPGISFEASIEISNQIYLTDLSKSGVKYVRSVSTLRKFIEPNGTWTCNTDRSPEDDTETGWHLDLADPIGTLPEQLKYFTEGNLLEIVNNDSPAQSVPSSNYDAIKIDDRFEEYIVYFYGDDPSNPYFQKRIGSLYWQWGGLSHFKYPNNPQSITAPYTILESYGTTGIIINDKTVSERQYDTIPVQELKQLICRTTSSLLDGSYFFVSQQYRDFLNRQPTVDEVEAGRFQIAPCVFDLNCVASKQAIISRDFFRHPEFVAVHPELDPSLEGTHDFNVEFVRQSYYVYLRSVCNPAICDRQTFENLVAQLDATGDYIGMVNQFITLAEYKNRFPLPSPLTSSVNQANEVNSMEKQYD